MRVRTPAAVVAGLLAACYIPVVCADSASGKDDPLAAILASRPDLAAVAGNAEHEVQIRYTEVTRDANGAPRFRVFEHGADPDRYFYPASTVKLPIALMALETLRGLEVDGLTPDTTMLTGAATGWQTSVKEDPSSSTGLPSVAHYVRKIFLVSDNDASNRLYELVGADDLNQGLRRKGYEGVRIFHRLAVRREPYHGLLSNPVTFLGGERVLLERPARKSVGNYHAPAPILRGKGYLEGGEQVAVPKDFAGLNCFPLRAQQEILKALVFPEAVSAEKRFEIAASDRRLVLRAMGQRPREAAAPRYDPVEYPDAYAKFLFFGGGKEATPDHLRSIGKSGLAYGFLTDNIYFVDFEQKIEFFLAAVIHVNANGIYNDDQYEYDTIGLPFLRDLGRAAYEHELGRKGRPIPDLGSIEALFE